MVTDAFWLGFSIFAFAQKSASSSGMSL